MRFAATIDLHGKTATGIRVPHEVVTGLGSGRRPKVAVTIGRHTYRTTVFFMDGQFLIPLSAEHRRAAGVDAGDQVEVGIEVDAQPREVNPPDDLQAILDRDPQAKEIFEGLSFTHRKEWVRWIEEAKRPQTRKARLDKTIDQLKQGKKGH